MKEVGAFEWGVFIFSTALSLLTSHPKCGSVSLKCFLSKAGKFGRKTGTGTPEKGSKICIHEAKWRGRFQKLNIIEDWLLTSDHEEVNRREDKERRYPTRRKHGTWNGFLFPSPPWSRSAHSCLAPSSPPPPPSSLAVLPRRDKGLCSPSLSDLLHLLWSELSRPIFNYF